MKKYIPFHKSRTIEYLEVEKEVRSPNIIAPGLYKVVGYATDYEGFDTWEEAQQKLLGVLKVERLTLVHSLAHIDSQIESVQNLVP